MRGGIDEPNYFPVDPCSSSRIVLAIYAVFDVDLFLDMEPKNIVHITKIHPGQKIIRHPYFVV